MWAGSLCCVSEEEKRKRMRNRLYSPNASLHPGVKMGASELSWKHYEMEGDNLWWTGILSRGV